MDNFSNNILRLAGNLAPKDQLNRVSGAALQMQRELQWFKEVEKLVPNVYKMLGTAERHLKWCSLKNTRNWLKERQIRALW